MVWRAYAESPLGAPRHMLAVEGDVADIEPLILPFRHGPFRNVSYLLACPETRRAMAIDPAWDTDVMLATLEAEGFELEAVLLSHGHHDHVHGVHDLVAATGASVFTHRDERLDEVRKTYAGAISAVASDDEVEIGRLRARVLHTPGHTGGSISAFCGSHLFPGDTMMVSGMGRPGPGVESVAAMWESVVGVFQGLAGDVVVHPGHDSGPAATITMAEQIMRVAALRARTFDEFVDAMERETGRILRE